jgi:HD-GYP domain-containing protein (c-di-GMP phosphodiesterase class II)
MHNEKKRLNEIINHGIEISRSKDLDQLLEKVLRASMEIVNAEAGSIYIRNKDKLKFSYTRNELLQKRLPKGKKLIYSTFVVPVNNNSIAGYVTNKGQILNIPDVYNLPESVPYSFDSGYDEISEYHTKSMLTLPLKMVSGDIIGVLQLINARDSKGDIIEFPGDDEPLLRNFANIAAGAIDRAQLTRVIILRVMKMAEMRDPKETGMHVNRVASCAVEIYEEWAGKRGVPQKEIEKNKDILRMGAMLHDAGKVAISDAILKKPAKLEPHEFEIMKQHTFMGAGLFSEMYSDIDEIAFEIALEHHEHWDGNGYPGHINPETGEPLPGYETGDGKAMGKKAEEISVFGRVVAIADVYDALSFARVYKDAWDEPKVLEVIRSESGKQFDPEMVDAFFSCLDVIRSIGTKYPD